ncbi:hypothetical protein vseg_008264 [Gypsophila vaccaria]
MRRSSRLQGISPIEPAPERSILRKKRVVQMEGQTSTLFPSDSSPDDSYLGDPSSQDDTESISDSIPNFIPGQFIPAIMPKLSAHSMPDAASILSGFAMPETIQGNFEIKPAFLNLVERNQFGGNATEDPSRHMQMFTDYCSTLKQSGITQSKIREMLFPLSLRDRAREWITDLDKEAAGITDWNSLALAFYQKYYPPERTNQLRSQITSFKQTFDESLGEAWERYKNLIRECPHHGLGMWLVVKTFYNGLFVESRAIIDSAANGRFANNTDDDNARALIEEMAVHSSQYGKPRGNSRQAHGGSSDREVVNAVMTQLFALSAKVDAFGTGISAPRPVLALSHVSVCGSCGGQGHHASECTGPHEQVNAFHLASQKPGIKINRGMIVPCFLTGARIS